MKPTLTALLLPLVAVSWMAQPARAGGFYIGEQGARATGNAGAATATVDDASAVFYNPAAVSRLKGLNLTLGGGLILPSSSYEAEGAAAVSNQETLAFVPHGYVTYESARGFGMGLGVSAPFGVALRWPENSPGRFIIEEQRLQTIAISAVVALDASSFLDGVSAGVGLDIIPAFAYLARDIPIGTELGSVELEGNGLGVGFRFGLLYTPSWLEGLSFGFSGWTPVELTLNGKVDFDAPDEVRSALPPDGAAIARLDLPASLTLGIAYEFATWLTLSTDISWFGWSSFDSLDVELPERNSTTQIKALTDTVVARLGVTSSFGFFTVRAGYAYDMSPVPASRLDPTLPDLDRHLVAGGIGVALPAGIDIDASVLTVIPGSRESASTVLPATYNLGAFVIELSVGFQFGGDDEESGEPEEGEEEEEEEEEDEDEDEEEEEESDGDGEAEEEDEAEGTKDAAKPKEEFGVTPELEAEIFEAPVQVEDTAAPKSKSGDGAKPSGSPR